MAIDRSHPAFPSSPQGNREEHLGMTLREWYAGEAMKALLSSMPDPEQVGRTEQVRRRVAIEAHAMADAMLSVRSSS